MEISRVPNKLKMFRRCSGYSQKKVARMLGFSDTSTLSRWEHGLSVPSMVQVFRLARIYRTWPHELFTELWYQVDTEPGLLTQTEESITPSQSFHI
jgi:transcriptional regulator with XRE-family HTH domain